MTKAYLHNTFHDIRHIEWVWHRLKFLGRGGGGTCPQCPLGSYAHVYSTFYVSKKCCNIKLIIIGFKYHVIMPHLWKSQNSHLSVEYHVGQEENLYSARSVVAQF